MKIIAIKDRLVDYFQVPMVVHREQDVYAAIAKDLNGEAQSEIAHAPDHFEIWLLGELGEQGVITPRREFLISCNSLIRPGVRNTRGPSDKHPQGPAEPSRSPPDGAREGLAGHHSTGLIPDQAPPEARTAAEVRPGPEGGH